MDAPAPVRRWPWWCAALLLLASGLATALSVWVHWLPCRGSMLNGSIAFGYQYRQPDFSVACLRRMDGGGAFPSPTDLTDLDRLAVAYAVAAMTIAAAAWVPLIVGLRWGWPARLAATGAIAVSLATTVHLWTASRTLPAGDSWSMGAGLPSEIAGVVAVIVVWRLEPLGAADRRRLLLLAWGATAFGVIHQIVDYLTMVTLSDANWDTPPGTGYGIAVVLVAAAVGIAVVSLREGRPPAAERVRTVDPALSGLR